MKLPLDHVCVRTGILCPLCERKVSSGMVEPFEVDVMRAITDLEQDQELKGYMGDMAYVKAYRFRDTIVILVDRRSEIPQEIYQRISRSLGDLLKANVRILWSSKDLKSIASQLLFPARILGVNIVWLPDGSSFYVLRIPRRDLRGLSLPLRAAEQILSKIAGSSVQIRSE